MRIKYEVEREPGCEVTVAAIITLNKREQKKLKKILEKEKEITLSFWTTIYEARKEIIIEQTLDYQDLQEEKELFEEEYSPTGDPIRDAIISLRDMVDDEIDDLKRILS